MKTHITLKVKIAREALHLSQSAVERESGYDQSRISLLEAGKSPFIPNVYLSFLAKRGINLSAMFDERVSADEFENVCLAGPINEVRLDQGDCPMCMEKERELGFLRDNIQDLRTMLYRTSNLGEQSAVKVAGG